MTRDEKRGLTFMPMTGWGVVGGAVKDLEDSVQVAYAELDKRDYVFVPGDVLPPTAALATAALVQHYAAEFGIAMPPLHFFAETPGLDTPWLERFAPEQRAMHFFRDTEMAGFATQAGHVYINVEQVLQGGAELIEIVAHELAHVAGLDERDARAFGSASRDDFGGG